MNQDVWVVALKMPEGGILPFREVTGGWVPFCRGSAEGHILCVFSTQEKARQYIDSNSWSDWERQGFTIQTPEKLSLVQLQSFADGIHRAMETVFGTGLKYVVTDIELDGAGHIAGHGQVWDRKYRVFELSDKTL